MEEFLSEEPKDLSFPKKYILGGAILLVILGGATGFLLSKRGASSLQSPISGGETQAGEEVGSADVRTFRDTATGILEAGGLDGEGTHKLIREGGPSQTAYLTSSVVDLDKFAGKKVQVWGETFRGQKAGWLMDVGRVKVLE
ncbi:hypothetical protein FJZ40_00825 [Candidatus Shapirobacteria bacterium]|nr:hypothetical protein [Candidatus Shapirobacteria bacterium]